MCDRDWEGKYVRHKRTLIKLGSLKILKALTECSEAIDTIRIAYSCSAWNRITEL